MSPALAPEQQALVSQAQALMTSANKLAQLYDAPLPGDQHWESNVLAEGQALRDLLAAFALPSAAGLNEDQITQWEGLLSSYRDVADEVNTAILSDTERMFFDARLIYLLETGMLRLVNAILTPVDLLIAASAPMAAVQGPFSPDTATILSTAGVSRAITFSHDGSYIAAATGGDQLDASINSQVMIWEVAQGSQINRIEQRGYVSHLAFNPAREELAVGQGGFGIELSALGVTFWDAQVSGSPRAELQTEFPVSAIAYSPDGRLFALASGEAPVTQGMMDGAGRLLLFDTQEFSAVSHVIDSVGSWSPPGYVSTARFSADGKLLAAGTMEGEVRLFDLAAQQELFRLPASGWVLDVALADDGQTLAASVDPCGNNPYCTVDYNLAVVWDLRDGSERLRIRTDGTAVSVSSDGEYLMVGDALWHLPDATPLLQFDRHSALMHPARALLAIGDAEGVAVWDIAANTTLARFPCPGLTELTSSPDGSLLAAGCGAELRLWPWP